MGDSIYGSLPDSIRKQIDLMASAPEAPAQEGYRELLARNWRDKYELFTSQSKLLGMEEAERLDADDCRGLIILTYSGSLLSMGPAQEGGRWLEYASIKLRADVPDIVSGTGAVLSAPPAKDQSLAFSKGPIESTSAIYRIAVCAADLSPGEQDRRVREAAIFLTNGFLKLNRGLSQVREPGAEQFTLGGMARYLAGKHDMSIAQAKQFLDDFFSTAESGLLLGERVSMGRLGHLSLKLRAAQKARVVKNPQTQADILIPAKPATPVPRMAFSAVAKEKSARVDPAILSGDSGEDEE